MSPKVATRHAGSVRHVGGFGVEEIPEPIFGGVMHHSRRLYLVTALAVALVAPAGAETERKPLRLEEIFSKHGLMGPQASHLQWSPDGRLLTYMLETADGGRDLWSVDPVSGEKRILVSGEILGELAPTPEKATDNERERERRKRYAVAAYLWAPDSKAILFTSTGRLYLYDLAAERAKPLAPEKSAVRNPRFSPNGRWVSFVYKHDLWLVPPSGGEPRQLTFDATDLVLHGDLDWIYPEEFALRSGYHWSPDSRRIAFLELDQTEVPSYPISDLLGVQPTIDNQRYPKAGDPNPRARVGIVEAKPNADSPPPIVWVNKRAEYIPRIQWANDGRIAVQFLNRAQTELELVLADVADGKVTPLIRERDRHWINITNDLSFLKDTKGFLWTSERDGLRRIYRYGPHGRPKKILTGGDAEVERIVRVDEEGGWVYYTSNRDNPLGSDLYRARLDGSGRERLTGGKGTHRVSMNKAGDAYVVRHSSLLQPPITSVHHLPSGKKTVAHRSASPAGYGLAEPRMIELKTPDEALIRIQLLEPEAREAGHKHPLLVYVYGGPHAPTIRDRWGGRGRFLFHQYLTRKGYAVAMIDDRASSIRGHRYETALYRKYGPVAVMDYEAAVKHLAALDFIDKDRIGIWGWSGGGFSTCLALTKSKSFRVGIAVAPVTDWKLYDSIYTERYMGLPSEEPQAYSQTSAVEGAKNLHGRLLLAHPTSDDNVHLQNTMKMVHALIQAGKPYDLLLYPGKTHSLYGGKERLHLFRRIEEYLDRNL